MRGSRAPATFGTSRDFCRSLLGAASLLALPACAGNVEGSPPPCKVDLTDVSSTAVAPTSFSGTCEVHKAERGLRFTALDDRDLVRQLVVVVDDPEPAEGTTWDLADEGGRETMAAYYSETLLGAWTAQTGTATLHSIDGNVYSLSLDLALAGLDPPRFDGVIEAWGVISAVVTEE